MRRRAYRAADHDGPPIERLRQGWAGGWTAPPITSFVVSTTVPAGRRGRPGPGSPGARAFAQVLIGLEPHPLRRGGRAVGFRRGGGGFGLDLERDGEAERRTHSGVAHDPDAAAVRFDHL